MRRVLAANEKPLHWVRAVYTVRFPAAIYVLHAFQKKSPSGIRTAKRDVEVVAQRLKVAHQDYEEHYGKPKKKE